MVDYRILLIDDDEVDARVIQRSLSTCGLNASIQRAVNSEQGKQLIEQQEFDCILLDYILPEGTSLELFQDLLEQPCSQRPPIIMLTGISSAGVAAQSIQLGAQEYLNKDELTPWTLQKLIESACDKSVLQQQIESRDEELISMGFYDSLTGLPNRQLFQDRLEQSIHNQQRDGDLFAILMMDLDLFKEINDTYGHEAGDNVLQQAGERLNRAVREADTVARLGGDEFSAILTSMTSRDSIVTVIEKIIEAIAEPFSVQGKLVNIGISIGYAFCPEDSEDASTLLRFADMAMYQAKKASLGYSAYSSEKSVVTETAAILSHGLPQAIKDDQFSVYYQPQIKLSTGHIYGAEALIRWHHPELGLIRPDQFIAIAERSRAIDAITLHVLAKALARNVIWQDMGFELSISINLSARVLHNEDVIENIIDLVHSFGINPQKICLEVTETAVMQSPEVAIQLLTKLSDAGIRLSIDDFGTGYSSLKYLKGFPINEIKIGREFISGLLENSAEEKIVTVILALGRSFDLDVVAEGVEDDRTLRRLHRLGCQYCQGNHISTALDHRDFELWLESSSRHQAIQV
ncbi:MAG: EAL domain-containing protein [Gammaproteobacteria bacterium]|nr:EAL domain-containing protein [Gammaproteobacteria bacterium]